MNFAHRYVTLSIPHFRIPGPPGIPDFWSLTLILWPWAFDLEPFPYKLKIMDILELDFNIIHAILKPRRPAGDIPASGPLTGLAPWGFQFCQGSWNQFSNNKKILERPAASTTDIQVSSLLSQLEWWPPARRTYVEPTPRREQWNSGKMGSGMMEWWV